MGVESFACYVSDDALSIDNVFVILFIASSFGRIARQKVLLFGIVSALAKYRTKIGRNADGLG
jgi:tellurite resistance protein TerC